MTTEEIILNAAYSIAEKQSLAHVTSPKIAASTKFSRPTIFYQFKTIESLRDKVIEKAIAEENVKILRQIITTGHKAVKTLSPELRKKVVKSLF